MNDEDPTLDPPAPCDDEVGPRTAAFQAAAERCQALLDAGSTRAAAEVYRDAVDAALDRLLEIQDRMLDRGDEDPELQRASDAAELLAESLVLQLEARGIAFDEVELPILDDA